MNLSVLTAAQTQATKSRRLAHELRVRVRLVEHMTKATKPAVAVLALAATLGSQIEDLAQSLGDGELEQSEFVDSVRALLIAAGGDAAALAELDDTTLIDALMEGQTPYVEGFASDIAGGLSLGEILSRSGLYAGLAWSAYQMARAQTFGEKAEITWVCEDDAASCDECVAAAEGSPYTLESLPGYPGGLQCLGNCRCSLDGPGGE